MDIRRILIAGMLCLVTAFSVTAQQSAGNLFGDNNQPGNKLHTNIVAKVDSGTSIPQAIVEAVESSISEDDNTLNGDAKAAVAFDVPLADQFFVEMMASNSLIEVTKVLVESNPEKAVHVITLAVVLYPDYAQEVFDGAALTGVMSSDDILVVMLQAGVDPTSVSNATAAGTGAAPIAATVPLGAGIGAGGTGGGDTTASSN